MDGWERPSARGKEENDANARAPSKPSAIFFLFFPSIPFHFFSFFFLTSLLSFSHVNVLSICHQPY